MTTVHDVPAEPLIESVATDLASHDEISAPDWAEFVRTGVHKEKPPESDAWWNTRTAAVLRKVYLLGPIGTERLSAKFGGKKDGGVAPAHAAKGSRNIIRTILQQLEAAGLVETSPKGGRVVTPEGQRFLDDQANNVKQELVSEIPELEKY